MNKKNIKKLIQSDIRKAVLIIFKKLGKSNGEFLDLFEKYRTKPEGFSMTVFRDELTAFVVFCDKLEFNNKTSPSFLNSHDKLYEILCELNFKNQYSYFLNIIKSNNPIIPIIVRAKYKYGQKWFYNRLIHTYKKSGVSTHSTIHYSFTNDASIREGIDAITGKMGGDVPSRQKSFEISCHEFEKAVIKKIKESNSSQFIILKNSEILINSDEFQEVYKALNNIHEEAKKNNIDYEYKCIIIFVEENNIPYEEKEVKIKEVISSKIRPNKVKVFEELKLIDLQPLTPITINCLEDWIDGINTNEFNVSFIEDEKQKEEILFECDDGNPRKVIEFLCQKLTEKNDTAKDLIMGKL